MTTIELHLAERDEYDCRDSYLFANPYLQAEVKESRKENRACSS
jgi:hypothetical protein